MNLRNHPAEIYWLYKCISAVQFQGVLGEHKIFVWPRNSLKKELIYLMCFVSHINMHFWCSPPKKDWLSKFQGIRGQCTWSVSSFGFPEGEKRSRCYRRISRMAFILAYWERKAILDFHNLMLNSWEPPLLFPKAISLF